MLEVNDDGNDGLMGGGVRGTGGGRSRRKMDRSTSSSSTRLRFAARLDISPL